MNFFFKQITIVAQDFGVPPLQGSIVLVVNVIRNVYTPIFPSSGFAKTIDNDIAIGTSVLEATATDIDQVRSNVC